MKLRFLAALLLGAASALGAQQTLRGAVSDSATQRRVSGAIVMLLDSAGASLSRNISNEDGEYVLPLREGARRLRVQRLGFRPREIQLPARAVRIDVAMLPIAAYLEAVNVSASQCSARRDRGQAIALFEQAKAGLLATVVAREANPARMVMYRYERTMDGMSDRVIRQTVGVDSAVSAKVTYSAAISGKEMVEAGFVRETEWGRVFLAPDADVLLGAEFAGGYCFSLAKVDTARPNQLGIAFDPAASKSGRVDIQGALWLDTLKRELVDLEFSYVGLPRKEVLMRPGGHLEFREMPNGAVVVDRWNLRLIAYESESVQTRPKTARSDARYQVVSKNYVAESGGELAQARWRDGNTWRASLGRARITATDSAGKPKAGVKFVLDETPYEAVTGADGVAEFTDVVPGPYQLMVDDPAMRSVGLLLPTAVTFRSTRGSLFVTNLRAPTASEFIYKRCVADKQNSTADSTRILFRAMTHTDEPLGDVDWTVKRRLSANALLQSPMLSKPGGEGLPVAVKAVTATDESAYRTLREGGFTGTDGMFQICLFDLHRGSNLLVQLRAPGYEDANFPVTLTSATQVIRLNLLPKP